MNSFQVPIRGCVIGGTALLDPSVRAQPYPSTALAAEPASVVEFSYGALRSAMDENPAIEAAILNVLYFDLVEGLRRRGQYDYAAKEAARKATGGPVAPRKLPTIMQEDVRVTMYELIMRVALADGVVHSAEREFLAKYQMENAITDAEHVASLEANGWTAAQWDAGVQEGQLEGGTAAIKSAIPDLLTQAGIGSRLTDRSGEGCQMNYLRRHAPSAAASGSSATSIGFRSVKPRNRRAASRLTTVFSRASRSTSLASNFRRSAMSSRFVGIIRRRARAAPLLASGRVLDLLPGVGELLLEGPALVLGALRGGLGGRFCVARLRGGRRGLEGVTSRLLVARFCMSGAPLGLVQCDGHALRVF